MQAKSHLKLVPPIGENRAVAPVRRPNAEYRKREHLTQDELAKLFAALKGNRHGHRDHMMALVTFLLLSNALMIREPVSVPKERSPRRHPA